MYEMYPVVDKMKCDKHKMSDGPEDQTQDLPEMRKLLQNSNEGPKLGFVSSQRLPLHVLQLL